MNLFRKPKPVKTEDEANALLSKAHAALTEKQERRTALMASLRSEIADKTKALEALEHDHALDCAREKAEWEPFEAAVEAFTDELTAEPVQQIAAE